MAIRARPMKPRPRPALRADVCCRSWSASPIGRAMPNFRPDPVGSGGRHHDPIRKNRRPRLAPGPIAGVCKASTVALSALVGRVELPVLRDRERHLASIARRRFEDRRQQLRQIDVRANLADDFTIPLQAERQPSPGQVRQPLRLRRRWHRRCGRCGGHRRWRDRRGGHWGGRCSGDGRLSGSGSGRRLCRGIGRALGRWRGWRRRRCRGGDRGRLSASRRGHGRLSRALHPDIADRFGPRLEFLPQQVDALLHAAHALIDLGEDRALLLGRHRIERGPIRCKFPKQIASDLAQVDPDLIRIRGSLTASTGAARSPVRRPIGAVGPAWRASTSAPIGR